MGDAKRRREAGIGPRPASDPESTAARLERREAATRSKAAEAAARVEMAKDRDVVRAAITLKQAVSAAKARRAFLDATGDETIGPELQRALREMKP